MAHGTKEWTPIASFYDPLMAGSIDGTDENPHDNGIVRAMNAVYKPNKQVVGDPRCTIFVSRLNPTTREEALEKIFLKYGKLKRLRLVRDIITGISKRYAFIEYFDEHCAYRAQRDANKAVIDDRVIFVDFEVERTLPGWIPRRLGGGLGGNKESGQLRFGGKDRPFKKPIVIGMPAAVQHESCLPVQDTNHRRRPLFGSSPDRQRRPPREEWRRYGSSSSHDQGASDRRRRSRSRSYSRR